MENSNDRKRSEMSTKHPGLLTPKKGKDVDMTQGNILRHLIMFAFPLL